MALHISVAMCNFNGSRFIGEQLESIAAQTISPCELVVCDDGSTDDSLQIVERFAQRVQFPVRIERNVVNLGTTRNFEKAITLCRGEIIVLADFDDVWKPQKLAVLDEVFRANVDVGYAFSNAELIDANGRLVNSSLWTYGHFRRWRVNEFTRNNQVATLLGLAVVTGAAMGFRSSLRDIVLPFSRHFIHDYWMSLILSCVGFYGHPITEPLLAYRQHQAQKTGVRPRSPGEKISYARKAARAENDRRLAGYQDVQERLARLSAAGCPPPSEHMVLIDEMLTHCRNRVAAHRARGSEKPRIVWSEATSGRYKRFSNSWHSIIQDLCF